MGKEETNKELQKKVKSLELQLKDLRGQLEIETSLRHHYSELYRELLDYLTDGGTY